MLTVQRATDFTCDLANALLAPALGQPVTAVHTAPLGEGVGLMSAIARATLTLADDTQRTVVFKYPAETANADIAKGLNYYRNELNFYRELAADSPIEVPACLHASIDEATQDFLLILEDRQDAPAGDQLRDCDEALMGRAFTRAGELHGRFWSRTQAYPWLTPHNEPAANRFRRDAIFRPGVAPTLERFGELFTGNSAETVAQIAERFVELFELAMAGPQTFIHGDYRTDNMLLPEQGGMQDIIAVDWQNCGSGKGPHDIAYFSAQSCGAALRGDVELAQLRRYHDVLVGSGVRGYSFDECLHDYRLNLMITMITPVAVCGTLDPGNERGVALGRTMLTRSLAAMESMDCADLLQTL
ncbi:MAG: phosphotransferase [Pseudomonadota bacterium]